MNVTVLSVEMSLVLLCTCGCSKAESAKEMKLRTMSRDDYELLRPRHYLSTEYLRSYEEDTGEKLNVESVQHEIIQYDSTLHDNYTYVDIVSTNHNNKTFFFYLYKDSKRVNNPYVATMKYVVEQDETNAIYLASPVTPAPYGKLIIPDHVGQAPVVGIGNWAFASSIGIDSIIFPETLEYVEDGAFLGCTNLSSLTIPASVRRIGQFAFASCSNLTELIISDRNEELIIEDAAFQDCHSIRKMTLPQDFKAITFTSNSFDNAFCPESAVNGIFMFDNWYFCLTDKKKTNISIPHGAILTTHFKEDLYKIDEPFSMVIDTEPITGSRWHGSYEGLTNLHSLILGQNVANIGAKAFANCPNLTNLVFNGKIETIGEDAFLESDNLTVKNFQMGDKPRSAVLAFSTNTLAKIRKTNYKYDLLLDFGIFIRVWNSINTEENARYSENRERLSSNYAEYERGRTLRVLKSELPFLKNVVAHFSSSANHKLSSCEVSIGCEICNFLWGLTLPYSYAKYSLSTQELQLKDMYDYMLFKVSDYLAEEYDHPCAYEYMADIYKSDDEKIKAIKYFKMAAIGFAEEKCNRVLKNEDDRPKYRSLGMKYDVSTQDGKIAKCIQAIDNLGFHSVAEALLFETQSIIDKKEKANIKDTDIHFGTAWFINEDTIMTCHHVIESCSEIWTDTESGNRIDFSVIADDKNHDIVILKATNLTPSHTALPICSRLASVADNVFTFGYPLPSIMGSEKKYNEGTISALSGIGGDNRFYQISIPLQPGNSGGAIVSKEGVVIGLAAAGLDAEKVFNLTGVIPQNVNYAIKSRYITALLQDNGIGYNEKPSKAKMDRQAIVDQVSRATILIKAK